MANLFARVFGSRNQRTLARLQSEVERINTLEEGLAALSDEALQGQTDVLRQKLVDGKSLEDILPEAFAVVREAGKRVLGMRHFDVQLIGGMVLNEGRIAEMRTGEGKTLVSTLAAYLNALPGNGVHVVTVNDYLARRDAEWMGRLHNFLGLSVGVVLSGQSPDEKRAAYASDITYGTNNEFGFDYLRDNMAFTLSDKVQRGQNFAIVDEVDSILIDEARTPLIISGPTDDDPELYRKINQLVPSLTVQAEEDGPGDFSVDAKSKQVHLTEDGHQRVEELMLKHGLLKDGDSLYDAANIILVHHLQAALRAHALYKRDVDYIVAEGQVVIVDEFTGRTMPGRRWSDGLHQAVEAKEGVNIQQENQTLASITFQNYFRLYDKLSGMTGTADTEAFEFNSIYGLDVVVIPTNRPMIRDDRADLVFMSPAEKFDAIVDDIVEANGSGQPVLVGTASIETSEYLADLLRKKGVPHEVLNAKQHEREAEIIAQAGRPGAVTIATNMAGRGTDIVLGGNLETELEAANSETDAQRIRDDWKQRHTTVLEAGGLYVVGSERHESRRIDNQLRGRSGRQGDPGATRFYLSLEDNLMRIFAPPSVKSLLQRLGMGQGEAIEHRLVSRSIENAQRKVESHNFDIRKHLLEYDNVANDQRKVIYTERDDLMRADVISDVIDGIRGDVVAITINAYIPPSSVEELWDIEGLQDTLRSDFGLVVDIQKWMTDDPELDEATIRRRILEKLVAAYEEKKRRVGVEVIQQFERSIMLQVLDNLWREHLAAMDYLRQGIHLRGYAQKDPKQEYKREAFLMFSELLERLKHDVIAILSKVQVQEEADVEAVEAQRRRERELEFKHAEAPSAVEVAPAIPASAAEGRSMSGRQPAGRPGPASGNTARPETFVRSDRKVGRNEPCPCGSGRKFKQCHGKAA